MRSSVRGWLAGMIVVGLLVAGAGACTAAPPGALTLYNGDDGREVTVALGGGVEVRLSSTAATRWSVPTTSAADVVAMLGSKTEGGAAFARFEARHAGTAVLLAAVSCRPDTEPSLCRVDREPWRVTVHVLP